MLGSRPSSQRAVPVLMAPRFTCVLLGWLWASAILSWVDAEKARGETRVQRGISAPSAPQPSTGADPNGVSQSLALEGVLANVESAGSTAAPSLRSNSQHGSGGSFRLALERRPASCTLESAEPPPGPPGPRELRGLEGIGASRALQLARALWDLGPGVDQADIEALPGIGPVLAGRLMSALDRPRSGLWRPAADTESRLCGEAGVHSAWLSPYAGRPCPRALRVVPPQPSPQAVGLPLPQAFRWSPSGPR
ncbi:MAG: hypothetical protein ACI841_001315 [Planctomycetota bacterium]|jgi:hypothetical protein